MNRKTAYIVLACVLIIQTVTRAETIDEIKVRLNELAEAHGLTTQRQMQTLGALCYEYFEKAGAFPSKPSDLQTVMTDQEWMQLFASYDAKLIQQGTAFEDDPRRLWKWIDEKSSFKFHGLKKSDLKKANVESIKLPILLEEKHPIVPGHKIAVHQDGVVTFERSEDYP